MKAFAILVALALLAGCSANKIWYGSDVARISYVMLEAELDDDGNVTRVDIKTAPTEKSESGKNKKHLGALMAWSPEFNAAFISKSGNGCIQPATYSKTNSANTSIPAEIISSGVTKGDVTADFTQALEKLITVTDQSTFLSIGVYGLCQLHANEGLTDAQLTSLTELLFEKAAAAQGSMNSNNNIPKANDNTSVEPDMKDKS
jgi:hypothetical protein